MRTTFFIFCLMALFLGCEAPVNLAMAPDAVARCEAPTDDNLHQTARMLPGRMCQACHVRDGEAGRFVWTASGTVYANADSPCNDDGLEGVKVELLDASDNVLLMLFTNRSGNFFTAEPLSAPRFRIRLSKDGKTQEMQGLQPTGACAACHYPNADSGAPGRVFLN